MLAGIEGKDLRPKFFLGMVLGVMESQTTGQFLFNFDPSMNHCYSSPERMLKFLSISVDVQQRNAF